MVNKVVDRGHKVLSANGYQTSGANERDDWEAFPNPRDRFCMLDGGRQLDASRRSGFDFRRRVINWELIECGWGRLILGVRERTTVV